MTATATDEQSSDSRRPPSPRRLFSRDARRTESWRASARGASVDSGPVRGEDLDPARVIQGQPAQMRFEECLAAHRYGQHDRIRRRRLGALATALMWRDTDDDRGGAPRALHRAVGHGPSGGDLRRSVTGPWMRTD